MKTQIYRSVIQIDKRMGKAMQLLEEKSMHVSDVAQAVGYVDASHFTRVFKQHTECTPTKWRKNWNCVF